MGFYTVYKKQKEYRYMKKTIKRKQKLGIRIGVGCALVITVILLAVQGVSNLTNARGAAPCSEQRDAKQPGHSNVRAVCLAERTYSR